MSLPPTAPVASEYKLQRPKVACPPDASLLSYEFSGLLIDALNQGCLVSYLGWYVDSAAKGPVWHRWGKGEETRLGVSLIVGVYALWVAARIDVVVDPREKRSPDVFLVLADQASQDLPPLEQDVLALVRTKTRLRARELVEQLPFPSKRRGIGAWFFSGAPSGQTQGKEGWFKRTSTFGSDAPARVQQALDLAKALVVVESGTDVSEEERDRRDGALYVMETEIFDAVHKLA